ncbi:diphosphomevalonate decarboxylase [Erysipelothrix sp. HDW6B]|uniref:diphosphomevalonate decarboxylase n=1 Tax=Erysipelothrix sp. HDW6B TaxID=2714929 RepID=UPI00140911C9|nr:diphosphomevalonate decarboxylase [Erysipelothrix sp. HDW6B]QIK87008.1 diphosphomevalonate decarboxylase [Erysipelothrix sp. HDW6B]
MKTVRAHTNIALIKYWGKKDNALKIPHNSSLSLTLDQFYTETRVEYDASLTQDQFMLDGAWVDDKTSQRVYWFMDRIRERYGIQEYARIISENHVPKEAGLASSASAFAALAKAATLDLNLDDREISRLARLGSGSASRSVYGDFVRWNRGTSDEDSFAEPITMEPWSDFRMIVCILNDQIKPFSSTDAMNTTVADSPYYDSWVASTEADLIQLEEAVKNHDIERVGVISQTNALKMHASLMAVNMWYFEPMTVEIMNRVRQLQKSIPAYFTMDAGPNVKIMTTAAHVETILEALPSSVTTVVCKSGPGLIVL